MRAWLLCAVAAMAGGLVYLNALHNPFVFDDQRVIVDNAAIQHLSDLHAIVMQEPTRPLVNLSYAVDRALWGPTPSGFHTSSVLLHIINIVLLFFVVRGLADDTSRDDGGPDGVGVAFAAAALFAVHPLMTDAVGYIAARTDVLYAVFFLSAFLCGRRWIRRGGWSWWTLSMLAWVAAMLAKESAVMLPFVLACYVWLIDDAEARPHRRVVKLLGPLCVLTAAMAAARLGVYLVIEHGGATGFRVSAFLEQAVVAWRYARLVALPSGQSIFHHVSAVAGAAIVPIASAVSICIVAAAALVRPSFADRSRLVRFGALWFLLLLLPSAVLVAFDRTVPMAEHRAYLASAGLLIVAAVIVDALRRVATRVSPLVATLTMAAFLVVLLSLASRTVLRNAVWADPVRLWSEAASLAPTERLPRRALAESLHNAGRHEEAASAYRAAIAIDPHEDTDYLNLATCLSELRRREEAAAVVEQLRVIHPSSVGVPIGQGAVALLAGDREVARRSFQDALTRDPQNVMALQWMAVLEEDSANPEAALRRCEELQHVRPGTSTEDCVQRNRELIRSSTARFVNQTR